MFTANQLTIELAMETLDRREWPNTEAEFHLLRSAMFTAQATMREMERRTGATTRSRQSAARSPK